MLCNIFFVCVCVFLQMFVMVYFYFILWVFIFRCLWRPLWEARFTLATCSPFTCFTSFPSMSSSDTSSEQSPSTVNTGNKCDAIITWSVGIILCVGSANERRRYTVTSSLINWAYTQNDPWSISFWTQYTSYSSPGNSRYGMSLLSSKSIISSITALL